MINVIGAGPAGLTAAYELAKAGEKVTVFEEHKEIGKPVQCTGIVTNKLSDIVKLEKNIILNRIKTARIISKHNDIDLPVNDIVIDRCAFDRMLSERAESVGAKIELGKKTDSMPEGTVIGADGPNSLVRKHMNPHLKTRYLIGKQATVNGEFESDVFQVYLGSTAPGFFGWIVPENETTARMGLAATKNTAELFKAFTKNQNIISTQAGLIPIYNRRMKTQMNQAYLIGDAATQVKATTGGGLIPGISAAKLCAKSILQNQDYERLWKTSIGKELDIHYHIRRALNKMTDHDLDRLIHLLDEDKVKQLFHEHDRDNSKALTSKLLIKQPRLLSFIPKLL